MRSWQHAASTNSSTISNWFTGLYRDHGVGIATGPESGVWVLDIDHHDADGSASLEALEAEHGTLPATVEAITGSGGRHLIFAYPPGNVKIGTTKNIGAGIDVRGDGGQILAYPTVHPNGQQYVWAASRAPGEIAVAQAPAWLLDLVIVVEQPKPESKPKQPTVSSSGEPDSIAEWLNRTHTWSEVLTLDGWQRTSQKGDDTYWARPGKDAGTSAVLHGDGPFVVFTTSVPELQQAAARGDGDTWAYSLFGYVAATRYRGDRSECARAYRNTLNAESVRAVTYEAAKQAHTVLDQSESGDDDDWGAIDLTELAAALRAGEYEPIAPTILEVEHQMPLLYRERINGIFGESGGGKTWVGLQAVVETLLHGGNAMVLDWEDHPSGIVERLLLLGCEPEHMAQLDYRNPSTALSVGVDRLLASLRQYDLIMIDSTGEAMAAGGVDSNSDQEVAQWFSIVKKLSRLEGAPAVLIIDHTPKSEDAPKAFAIGSQRKRAAITGASYRVDTIKEPAKGRNGQFKLTVAKDRFGNRAKNTVAAIVDLETTDDTVRLRFHQSDAQAAADAGKPFRPTNLMERVSRYLEQLDSASARSVAADVQGKTAALRKALEVLVEEGYVEAQTAGRGLRYVSVRSYREIDEQQPVVEHPVEEPW